MQPREREVRTPRHVTVGHGKAHVAADLPERPRADRDRHEHRVAVLIGLACAHAPGGGGGGRVAVGPREGAAVDPRPRLGGEQPLHGPVVLMLPRAGEGPRGLLVVGRTEDSDQGPRTEGGARHAGEDGEAAAKEAGTAAGLSCVRGHGDPPGRYLAGPTANEAG